MQIPLYIYNFANCFFPVFFTPSLTLDQWSWKTPYIICPFCLAWKLFHPTRHPIRSDIQSDIRSDIQSFKLSNPPAFKPSSLTNRRGAPNDLSDVHIYQIFPTQCFFVLIFRLVRGWIWFERFAPGSLQRLRNLSLIQPFLVTNLVQTFSQPVCVAVYLHSLWESGNM